MYEGLFISLLIILTIFICFITAEKLYLVIIFLAYNVIINSYFAIEITKRKLLVTDYYTITIELFFILFFTITSLFSLFVFKDIISFLISIILLFVTMLTNVYGLAHTNSEENIVIVYNYIAAINAFILNIFVLYFLHIWTQATDSI